jgi:threonine/homoserine efflux transporter RhtA
LAALVGPLIVSALGSLKMTFLIAAVLAILGAMLTRITPRPDANEKSAVVLSSQN